MEIPRYGKRFISDVAGRTIKPDGTIIDLKKDAIFDRELVEDERPEATGKDLAVGITAYPVAIFSGDRTHVSREWPSLGAFNHAISAIRVGRRPRRLLYGRRLHLGRLLFFDPTNPYVPPGYLPDHEQASLALVAVGEGGDLVRVPASLPAAAGHDRQVEATLSADGSGAGPLCREANRGGVRQCDGALAARTRRATTPR